MLLDWIKQWKCCSKTSGLAKLKLVTITDIVLPGKLPHLEMEKSASLKIVSGGYQFNWYACWKSL